MSDNKVQKLELKAYRNEAKTTFEAVYNGLHFLARKRGIKIKKDVLKERAYQWLADKLKLDRSRCYFHLFNLNQCAEVITACIGIPSTVTDTWLEADKQEGIL